MEEKSVSGMVEELSTRKLPDGYAKNLVRSLNHKLNVEKLQTVDLTLSEVTELERVYYHYCH